MESEEVKRKLSAIFSTDVKGYSRLMGDDEAATVRTLTTYRKIITSLVEKHDGRVVDSPGDNLLAEFTSVVNAVQSAVDIQNQLKVENENLPQSRRMEFRIGINVGDVIQDGDRIYGDGVNIAARLESLSDGGGICISGDAYSQVYNKLKFSFQDIGEQSVKNIPRPLRAYKIVLGPSDPGKNDNGPRNWIELLKSNYGIPVLFRMNSLLLISIVGIGLIGGILIAKSVWFVGANVPLGSLTSSIASKPIIAVMPFINSGDDSGQDYYSRGISDDLTATLALFHSITVLSPEIYDGSKTGRSGMAEKALRYGARYLIQGNVRKSKDRIRVSTRLVEGVTGKVLWSKFLDRKNTELFEIQDIIVKEIASRLSIRVTDEEMRRISDRHIKDMDAYALVLKARHLIRQRERKAIFDARILLKKALKIDPEFCTANALLANSNVALVDYGWTEFPLDILKEGENFARNAKRKCPSDPEAHHVLALIYGRLGKHNLALQSSDFAISLNPSNPSLYISRAIALFWSGDAERAIENYEVGMRLGSKLAAGEKMLLGTAYFFGDRLKDSIILLEEILRERPDLLLGHAVLAAAFVKSKKMDLARHQLTVLKKSNPMIEIRDIGSSLHKKYQRELKNLLNTTGM